MVSSVSAAVRWPPARPEARDAVGPEARDAVGYARANRGRDLVGLARWLAIPSISGHPRHASDLVSAAAYLRAALAGAGVRTRVLPTGGAPVVVGDAGGPPGAPVVLIYGHYDVQPAGVGWTVPPFGPVRRGRDLLARGANDDKGQVYAVVAAVRAWRDTGGAPSRVVLVVEGAEEIGSPGLRAALVAVRRRLRPDVVVVVDTERASDGAPTVTLSQRGRMAVEVLVDAGGDPVHPGRLGGAVVDPSMVMADVLRELRGAVAPLRAPPGARDHAHPVTVRSDDDVRRAAGGRALVGGGLDRRISRLPAVSVTALAAGSRQGGNAVPARASARVDVRLPPGVDVGPVSAALKRIACRRSTGGVRVLLRPRSTDRGCRLAPAAGVLAALDRAARLSFGTPLRYVRSGGSLPAAALLETVFGISPVLLGLGAPDGRAHGPDERMDLPGWSAGVELLTHFLAQPVHCPIQSARELID